jgi:hypothetical protein
MAYWCCWSPAVASAVLLIVTLLLFYVYAVTDVLALAGALVLRVKLMMMFCIYLLLLDSEVLIAGNPAASVFVDVA